MAKKVLRNTPTMAVPAADSDILPIPPIDLTMAMDGSKIPPVPPIDSTMATDGSEIPKVPPIYVPLGLDGGRIPPVPPLKKPPPSTLLFAAHVVRPGSGALLPLTPRRSSFSSSRTRRSQQFGWLPDAPDARDHLYSAPMAVSLPRQFDLRDHYGCPPVYDQKKLGSCTANALAAALQFERMRQNLPRSLAIPSRLFIYFNERRITDTTASDCGAQLRDGIKSIASQGACFEGATKSDWPYVVRAFKRAPRTVCYQTALENRAISYSRLNQTVDQMRLCLASGYPFVFGFSVYESFPNLQLKRLRRQTGDVPLPGAGERVIGSHAVMGVGYDDDTQRFTVRNSWGKAWGRRGYCYMPYAYLANRGLASDFWTIRLVSAHA